MSKEWKLEAKHIPDNYITLTNNKVISALVIDVQAIQRLI